MPPGRARGWTNAGVPAAGCKLYTYEAGTSTPKETFQDAEGTVPHENPITLDAKGEALIYWEGNYKVDLRTAAGVQVTGYPIDNFETPVMAGTLAGAAGAGLMGFLYATVYGSNTVGKWLQDLATSAGSTFMGFIQASTGAVLRNVRDKLRDSRKSVKDFGAKGDGTTNDTAAFTLARAATNGAYHIPPGSYVVDASPDVFADSYTSGDAVTLIVGGVSKSASNAISGGLRFNRASAVKLDIIDAATGNTVMYLQNGAAGTATGFYRGLAFTTDSHFLQAQPSTLGGSTDLLFQRSTLAADPGGNRFNVTYEETPDRLLFNFATTASGLPAFDCYMRAYAGVAPILEFPALKPRMSQGIRITTRADGNFLCDWNPSTDRCHIEKSDLSVRHLTFKADGGLGFFGAGGTTRPTVTGSRGGNAALASLLTALSNLGLITDSTSA